MSQLAEDILRRHRSVTIAALAMLVLLAWAWIVTGAGMGMPVRAGLSLFPHRSSSMTMPMAWDGRSIAVALSMWWVMMVAMMIPAAAPVVLLYARVAPASGLAPHSGAFVAGYLVAWLGFSLVAVALQVALVSNGLLSPMGMALTSPYLAAAFLIGAGAYQLTQAKNACLSRCRNPAEFLSRHVRPGISGALRMGFLHGGYCVGCCWLLMALLFVGGIMNLVWIAGLTLVVAAEKLLPHGRAIARVSGVLFLAWGALILLAG